MRLGALVLFIVLAACSRGAEADLQYIKQARSVGAEWALVNEQAGQGKLTATYAASMHQWLRQQLQTASQSLTQPDSRYGQEIQALLDQPDDAAPEELRAHSDKLKQIEHSLESA
jgi:Tfp pilus assembly protein PilP